ncbi:MAG: lipid-binding SYLF domain-containing protein [Gemmataceae bacterium]|nr:lipid-binding SYLF domain-containing protein [Gemmataceae bacterium]
MKARIVAVALLLLSVLTVPGAQPPPAGKEVATLAAAEDVIDSLTRHPERCIPPALLHDAHAIAIVPEVLKVGFVVAGRHGKGVLVVREAWGGWGNPVFLTLTGGSVGWQAGAQSTDLVLVFRSKRSVDRLLQGKGKLSLGADASVAAGPMGREAVAATDLRLKAEVLSWSRARGLFAGVSLAGDALCVNHRANERFYGRRDVTPADIRAGRNVVLPQEALKLRAILDQRASVPRVAP